MVWLLACAHLVSGRPFSTLLVVLRVLGAPRALVKTVWRYDVCPVLLLSCMSMILFPDTHEDVFKRCLLSDKYPLSKALPGCRVCN